MMSEIFTEFNLISPLEKVYGKNFDKKNEYTETSALLGERVSFQVAYKCAKRCRSYDYGITVDSELSKFISIYNVEAVPCDLTHNYDECDDDYDFKAPTLVPDVLEPNINMKIEAVHTVWRSLWVTVETDYDVKAGIYPIKLCFKGEGDTPDYEKVFTLKYVNAKLPENELKVTQWFHGDCIATYYGVEMFSEEHWKRLEDFIKVFAHGGLNTILTPVFTPPLDTSVGGERPTIQLVDMTYINGSWGFTFDKLDRFVGICKKHGIKYFEIAHLFTQWGAYFTPKIVAETEEGLKRIFGWDVASDSREYVDFINAFLPALTAHLKQLGIDKDCLWHISDEPNANHLESYSKCKELVKAHLEGYRIMDALSDYDFYAKGIVEHPVVATDHIKKYLENDVNDLWVYYCSAQGVGVSNRFLAMPSYRNRVIAEQMYKYGITGFLHWGFNFYYSACSKYPVDPYRSTSAGSAFPSGDSFSVYPTKEGVSESLRFVVFHEALQDICAFKLLESLTSKEHVVKLIENTAGMTIEFDKYPKNADFILKLRQKVNAEIESLIK